MAARDAHGLIERCCRMEKAAWTEVYRLLERKSRHRIELQLGNAGIALDQAEDVLQELYFYLRSDDARRLRAFRGSTREEFVHFLQGIVTRFTSHYVRHWWRTVGREQQVEFELAPPDRSGATMEQVLAARLEFEASLNARERKRWQMVLYAEGLAGPPKGFAGTVPARTLSQWRQALYQKYLRLLRRA